MKRILIDLFRKFHMHLVVELGTCEKYRFRGVIIFRHFVPDSAFSTNAMLFIMITLPYSQIVEIIYIPVLNQESTNLYAGPILQVTTSIFTVCFSQTELRIAILSIYV